MYSFGSQVDVIVTKDHKKHEIEPLNCDELILKQSWHVETLEFELIGKSAYMFHFLGETSHSTLSRLSLFGQLNKVGSGNFIVISNSSSRCSYQFMPPTDTYFQRNEAQPRFLVCREQNEEIDKPTS